MRAFEADVICALNAEVLKLQNGYDTMKIEFWILKLFHQGFLPHILTFSRPLMLVVSPPSSG